MRRKIWNVKEITRHARQLAEKHKLFVYLVQIFLNRGICEDEFERFLNPTADTLHCPSLLPDIEKAANRIKKATATGEKILICGDYDVDGLTSLAIFYEYIRVYPDMYSFYIPHRTKEGYGLNKQVLEKAKSENRTLIVAFDCGTNSLAEIELAKEYGIDVIVVDHHLPKEGLNCPFAFVNPKRKDSQYPFYDLSSAALSFKLLQALKGKNCWQVLDLVALSVVCDVVPLKGENRALLQEGIKYLRRTARPAIKALCRVARLKQENIDTFHIGFILGPRINASGRVAHAQEALELFLSEDEEKAYALAVRFDEYNRRRRDIEARILKEAESLLETEVFDDHAIVVSGKNWHPGVLGIVASRLVDRYYRPSFVISFDDKVGKGSARSIHSVHLMEVLDKCAASVCSYGGHSRAAGIEIYRQDLDSFKDKVNSFLRDNLNPDDLIPVLDIDAKISF
ncbi:MAG: single-stranded-DNA-specific exonuclease RecJ, partial [Candidatus Omnitrophota bacterium]